MWRPAAFPRRAVHAGASRGRAELRLSKAKGDFPPNPTQSLVDRPQPPLKQSFPTPVCAGKIMQTCAHTSHPSTRYRLCL